MDASGHFHFDKEEFLISSINNYINIKWLALVQSSNIPDLTNIFENKIKEMIKLISELYNHYLELRQNQFNTQIFQQIMKNEFIVNLPDLKSLLKTENNHQIFNESMKDSHDGRLFKMMLSSNLHDLFCKIQTVAYKYQIIARFACLRDHYELGTPNNSETEKYVKNITKLIDMLRLCVHLNEEESEETFLEYLIEEMILKSQKAKVVLAVLRIGKKVEFSEKLLEILRSKIDQLNAKTKEKAKNDESMVIENQPKNEKKTLKKSSKDSSIVDSARITKSLSNSIEETTTKFKSILRGGGGGGGHESSGNNTKINSSLILNEEKVEGIPDCNSSVLSSAPTKFTLQNYFRDIVNRTNRDDGCGGGLDHQENSSVASGYTSRSNSRSFHLNTNLFETRKSGLLPSSQEDIAKRKHGKRNTFLSNCSFSQGNTQSSTQNAKLNLALERRNTTESTFKFASGLLSGGNTTLNPKNDKGNMTNIEPPNETYSIPITTINTKEELARKSHRSSLHTNLLNRRVSKIQVATKKEKSNTLIHMNSLPLFTKMNSTISNISSSNGSSIDFYGIENTSPLQKLFRNPSNPSTFNSDNKTRQSEYGWKSSEDRKSYDVLAESTPIKEIISENSLSWDKSNSNSRKLLDYKEAD